MSMWLSPCDTGHLEEQQGVKCIYLVPLYPCACMCPNLRGSEAEGGSDCVRPLPVLQHQPPVLGQGQVVTGGEVPESEGLTPADVAPTPAVKVTSTHYNETHTQIYKDTKVAFHKLWKDNIH